MLQQNRLVKCSFGKRNVKRSILNMYIDLMQKLGLQQQWTQLFSSTLKTKHSFGTNTC